MHKNELLICCLFINKQQMVVRKQVNIEAPSVIENEIPNEHPNDITLQNLQEIQNCFRSITELTDERKNMLLEFFNQWNLYVLRDFLPQLFGGFDTGINEDTIRFIIEQELIDVDSDENGQLLAACLYELFSNYEISKSFIAGFFEFTTTYFPVNVINYTNNWGNNLLYQALTNSFSPKFSVFNATLFINFLVKYCNAYGDNGPSYIISTENGLGLCPVQQLILLKQPELLEKYLSLPRRREELFVKTDKNVVFDVETNENYFYYEPLVQYVLANEDCQMLTPKEVNALAECFQVLLENGYDTNLLSSSTKPNNTLTTINDYLEHYGWTQTVITQLFTKN